MSVTTDRSIDWRKGSLPRKLWCRQKHFLCYLPHSLFCLTLHSVVWSPPPSSPICWQTAHTVSAAPVSQPCVSGSVCSLSAASHCTGIWGLELEENVLVFQIYVYDLQIMHRPHSKIKIQYTLANPNKGVPIQKISVPITEFVRIREVTLILWRIDNTKICDNPLLLVYSFNRILPRGIWEIYNIFNSKKVPKLASFRV